MFFLVRGFWPGARFHLPIHPTMFTSVNGRSERSVTDELGSADIDVHPLSAKSGDRLDGRQLDELDQGVSIRSRGRYEKLHE
jgi:hypothetical protein